MTRNEDDEDGTLEEDSEEDSEEDEDVESSRKLDDKLRKDLNLLREEKALNLKEKVVLELELKTLRKKREEQDKQQRDIQERLEETEKANALFEKEKMKRLNEIQLHIMLRVDQVKNLEVEGAKFEDLNTEKRTGKIMNDLNQCVLFTKKQLKGLANRENELKDEHSKIS